VRGTLQREEAREDRSPREIDSLPRRRGLREGPVRLRERLERAPHLRGRHRTEPRSPSGQIRPLTSERLEGLDSDQFALAVVVGCEDHLVRPLGEAAGSTELFREDEPPHWGPHSSICYLIMLMWNRDFSRAFRSAFFRLEFARASPSRQRVRQTEWRV